MLIAIFLLAGALAAVAGGLFASLQTYITPDAFTSDLVVLSSTPFVTGGRGSILGPLLGTIILTVLPELAGPLVAGSTFFYAALVLVMVLAVPGGIGALLDWRNRRAMKQHRVIAPRAELLPQLLGEHRDRAALVLSDIALNFGGVRAIDGLSLAIRSGEIHGLIGPNGSGKTTALNVISGYYAPSSGQATLNGIALPFKAPHTRAGYGIARTFQTPRLIGGASVIENVMIGGTCNGEGSFVESVLALPRHRHDEAHFKAAAMRALETVGLEQLAAVRADRLQPSELRFMEIARA